MFVLIGDFVTSKVGPTNFPLSPTSSPISSRSVPLADPFISMAFHTFLCSFHYGWEEILRESNSYFGTPDPLYQCCWKRNELTNKNIALNFNRFFFYKIHIFTRFHKLALPPSFDNKYQIEKLTSHQLKIIKHFLGLIAWWRIRSWGKALLPPLLIETLDTFCDSLRNLEARKYYYNGAVKPKIRPVTMRQ